jgi:hypothetical protein
MFRINSELLLQIGGEEETKLTLCGWKATYYNILGLQIITYYKPL